MKKLYRSRKNKMIAGVCGGVGEYFKIDPTVVRLVFILLSLTPVVFGALIYILAWIIIPKQPR